MRTRPAALGRILAMPAPPKALLSTVSQAAALPLHQAERLVKRLRDAAAVGVTVGMRTVTGVLGALSPARREIPTVRPVPPTPAPTPPVPPAARTVPPPAPATRPAPPNPPAPPVQAVPPHAAERLLADVPAERNGSAPSELHRPGEDPFPIKHYDTLTVAEVVTALRTLERQADVVAVARHELANRNRKSIATAAETRIAQLDRLDVRT